MIIINLDYKGRIQGNLLIITSTYTCISQLQKQKPVTFESLQSIEFLDFPKKILAR